MRFRPVMGGADEREEDPAMGQRLAELGAVPFTGNASQFGAMLALETERWRKVAELSRQKKG